MSNKYEKQSKITQKERKKHRMCDVKRAYETKEDAYQKGATMYHCPHCKKWHRSGSLKRLIRKVANEKLIRKIAKRNQK